MSGALKDGPVGQGATADPSMEDILASIRRILSEDEAAAPAQDAVKPPDVLTLDASMLVEPEQETAMPSEPAPEDPAAAEALPAVEPGPAPEAAAAPESAPEPEPAAELPMAGLVAPEAAAAAAGSVSTLLRTLAERQTLAVHHGGPTLEDIVRDEMRPLLKAWLDENLPPMVERLVRAEIERVVSRAVT